MPVVAGVATPATVLAVGSAQLTAAWHTEMPPQVLHSCYKLAACLKHSLAAWLAQVMNCDGGCINGEGQPESDVSPGPRAAFCMGCFHVL